MIKAQLLGIPNKWKKKIKALEAENAKLNNDVSKLSKFKIYNRSILLNFENGVATFESGGVIPDMQYFLACLMPNGFYCGHCVIDTNGIVTISGATYNMTVFTGEAWANISGAIRVK